MTTSSNVGYCWIALLQPDFTGVLRSLLQVETDAAKREDLLRLIGEQFKPLHVVPPDSAAKPTLSTDEQSVAVAVVGAVLPGNNVCEVSQVFVGQNALALAEAHGQSGDISTYKKSALACFLIRVTVNT
ncbi:MAG: hypothetical protein ABIZ64_15225 [Casimicrobium sp.]